MHDLSLRTVKLLNIVLITIPFVICWYEYYAQRIDSPYYEKGNWLVIALFVLLYALFTRTYDALLVSINRISEMVYSQALSVLLSDAVMFIIIWLLTKHFPNPLPGLLALVCQVLLAFIWSVLSNKWYYLRFPAKKTAVIFEKRQGMENIIAEYGLKKKFDIQLTMNVEQCLRDLECIGDMDAVFLSGVRSTNRNVILKYCVEKDIQVYVIPRVGDILMSGAKRVHMMKLPVLRVGRYNPSPEFLFMKRLFDIVSSAAALIILSPLLIVTAIAIKVSDGGPVFYKQCRLTKDGKTFNILKFRSMRVDAEKDGVARLSTGDQDDRITPVGRVIRKCRIDELPQLLNILAGSMSVVGPRPERPEIAAQYEEEMPEFRLRLQAKAGLTGYAQIYGKYNTTPYDKLQMDLMYISKPDFVEDMRLVFATIKILFEPESTEGIAEGQTTAMGSSEEEEKELVTQ